MVILILILSSMSNKHNSFSIHHDFRVVFNFRQGFQVLCLSSRDKEGFVQHAPVWSYKLTWHLLVEAEGLGWDDGLVNID